MNENQGVGATATYHHRDSNRDRIDEEVRQAAARRLLGYLEDDKWIAAKIVEEREWIADDTLRFSVTIHLMEIKDG